MSERWFPWCLFQARLSERLQRKLLEGAPCCHQSRQRAIYIWQRGGGRGSPSSHTCCVGTRLPGDGLSAGTHLPRRSSPPFQQIRRDECAGLVANRPFVESSFLEKWPSISDGRSRKGCNLCLWLASRSSFSADHIWGGRGKTTANKQKWSEVAEPKLD